MPMANEVTLPAAIAGIGTDLIHIHRIAQAYERFGDRFVVRILGPQEALQSGVIHAIDEMPITLDMNQWSVHA